MYERQVHYTTLTQTLLHVAAATANSKNRVFCLLLQCMLRLLGEKRNSYCIKKKKKKKEKRTHVRFSPPFFFFPRNICVYVHWLFVLQTCICMCVCACACVAPHSDHCRVFFFSFHLRFSLAMDAGSSSQRRMLDHHFFPSSLPRSATNCLTFLLSILWYLKLFFFMFLRIWREYLTV